MVKSLLLCCFFFSFVYCAGAAEPVGIEGLNVGAKGGEVKSALKSSANGAVCFSAFCTTTVVLKDRKFKARYAFSDNTDTNKEAFLKTITLDVHSNDFDFIKNFLIEKYGEPHHSEKRLSSIQLKNEIFSWSFSEGDVYLEKYAEMSTQSIVIMRDVSVRRRLEQLKK